MRKPSHGQYSFCWRPQAFWCPAAFPPCPGSPQGGKGGVCLSNIRHDFSNQQTVWKCHCCLNVWFNVPLEHASRSKLITRESNLLASIYVLNSPSGNSSPSVFWSGHRYHLPEMGKQKMWGKRSVQTLRRQCTQVTAPLPLFLNLCSLSTSTGTGRRISVRRCEWMIWWQMKRVWPAILTIMLRF